ncbi:hypothetical protein SP15_013 [Bacillus phage SP-15]|uniref:Uncharacterized protein n=1 Tax=Bacillus phage SP-15 TaxID=1792032 RepID=A0A127AVX8_9CAUD|nr:hypothetical protein SP15_013 [Bacillus phage SP-15]AMM44812.1 hypothetical protein SP15_013 [Bacillus phage SP-15]
MDNITAVFEWLNIFKGTRREFIGMFKGTPLLTTDHFRQRVSERYPKEVEMILGKNMTQLYEDISEDYRKYGVNKYHKGAIDYTTECTNHEGKKFNVNLMVNYLSDKVSSGSESRDKMINELLSNYVKESDSRKRSQIYKEFTEAVKQYIDPKYHDLVIRGKLRLGDFAVAMISIFGSVATPEDIAAGKLRKIKASEDTRYIGHRKLPRTSFNETEYNKLVKWSDNNISHAARKKSRDVVSYNEFTVL